MVCVDEKNKQLLKDTRPALGLARGLPPLLVVEQAADEPTDAPNRTTNRRTRPGAHCGPEEGAHRPEHQHLCPTFYATSICEVGPESLSCRRIK